TFLDERWAQQKQEATAVEVRAMVEAFVRSQPALSWALKPPEPPPFWWRVGQIGRVAAAALAGLVLLPFAVVGLPFFLVLLRLHERRDVTVRLTTPPERLARLEALEDRGVQNQ